MQFNLRFKRLGMEKMAKTNKGNLQKVFKPGYNIESKVKKDEISAEFEQYDRK